MQFTAEKVAQDYFNLGNQNPGIRTQANQDLVAFQLSPEAWNISMALLTQQDNQNLQFLGAQVIYLKVKSDFSTLQENEQEEIKKFIFNLLNEGMNKFNMGTFKQLCASITAIALRNMATTWETFLEDMMQLANSSNENLFAVLEIISNFSREFLESQMQEKHRIKVKSIFGANETQLSEFFGIILQKITDQNTIIKCLNSIESLCDCKVFELLHHPNLVETMVRYLSQDATFEPTFEALCEGIENSKYADILNSSKFEPAMKEMKEGGVKESVKKIIEFLVQDVYPKYMNLKDTLDSPYCMGTTQLATFIGVYFNIFILENTDHSKALVKFLLVCTSHRNKKISAKTFDFWTAWRQNIVSEDTIDFIRNSDFSYIVESFLDLYKIVIEKCKLNSLKIVSIQEARKTKIYNVDTDQEEDYDEDYTQIDLKKQNFSIREYRHTAEDVLYDSLIVLSTLQGQEGTAALFSLILPILAPEYAINNNINLSDPVSRADYLLNCEVLIFSVKFMLDNCSDNEPHQYILEMIKNMILLPREDILTRGILNFLAEASGQVKFLSEYSDQLFEYCLKDLLNPNLLGAAAKCFQDFSDSIGDKISFGILEQIAQIMDSIIYDIEDIQLSERIIMGIFCIASKVTDHQFKITFLQKIFSGVEEKFQSYTNYLQKNAQLVSTDPNIRKDALRLFKTMANILKVFGRFFVEGKVYPEELINCTVYPFMHRNIDFICPYFELFSAQPDFVGLYSLIIKSSVRICELKLENFYDKIFTSILQVFGANPKQNLSLLNTLASLIKYFEDSEVQKQWILNNLPGFLTSTLNLLSSQRDPDLILNWIDFIENIYKLYNQHFLSLAEAEPALEYILIALAETQAQEYKLNKQLTQFIALLFEDSNQIYNPLLLKILPKILQVVLIKLLQWEATTPTEFIISKIMRGFEQQQDEIGNVFMNALNNDLFAKVSDKQKSMFIQACYLYRNDSRIAKNIILAFKEFVQAEGLRQESMIFIEEKLLFPNRSQREVQIIDN